MEKNVKNKEVKEARGFTNSLLVSAALTGLLVAGGTSANAHEKMDKEIKGECHGINSCKGKGDCGGKGYSCAGKNSCKGKGWLNMSQEDCDKKGGQYKKG